MAHRKGSLRGRERRVWLGRRAVRPAPASIFACCVVGLALASCASQRYDCRVAGLLRRQHRLATAEEEQAEKAARASAPDKVLIVSFAGFGAGEDVWKKGATPKKDSATGVWRAAQSMARYMVQRGVAAEYRLYQHFGPEAGDDLLGKHKRPKLDPITTEVLHLAPTGAPRSENRQRQDRCYYADNEVERAIAEVERFMEDDVSNGGKWNARVIVLGFSWGANNAAHLANWYACRYGSRLEALVFVDAVEKLMVTALPLPVVFTIPGRERKGAPARTLVNVFSSGNGVMGNDGRPLDFTSFLHGNPIKGAVNVDIADPSSIGHRDYRRVAMVRAASGAPDEEMSAHSIVGAAAAEFLPRLISKLNSRHLRP